MLEGRYVGNPGGFGGADEGQHEGRDMSTTVAEFISTTVAELAAPDRSEAELRVELAAAYRLVDHFGWNQSIYGHLTVRVPGPERHFLINPYGLRFDEVTASNLVKIDLDGAIIGASDWPVNVAGFAIHGAVHRGAVDAHCVMHTHSPAGMAVAALACGLLPISMDATLFHGALGYHDYEGAIVSDEEQERLVRDLGDNRALIMRNHGLLAVGRTIAEAFLYLHRLESACRTQTDALAMNSPLLEVPAAMAEKSARQIDEFTNHVEDNGALEFAAFMRMIEQTDPGYRE
jgi:ribulose-5-phosphate 4-epimerase/fuculose-1-phosphate aldolase